MALIAETTENDINYANRLKSRPDDKDKNITNAISHAACTTAHDLGAKAIVTVTKTGGTAKMLSKFRPSAFAMSEKVCRQMNLSWGVTPLMMDEKSSTDELLDGAIEAAVEHGLLKEGDVTVITAGIPLGVSGNTNMLKVTTVGNKSETHIK